MAECLNVLLARTAANRPRDAIEAAQLLNAVAGDMPEIETLLREAFSSNHQVEWKRQGDQFLVTVNLPTGRRQIVLIERSRHAAADRLVTLSSVCGPVHPGRLEHALRLNSEISHGSLAVRDMAGQSMFVMVNTYPEATVDVEEIQKTVLELAHQGDAFEMLLSGEDRH
jgi:serine/threonine-protein kinase